MRERKRGGPTREGVRGDGIRQVAPPAVGETSTRQPTRRPGGSKELGRGPGKPQKEKEDEGNGEQEEDEEEEGDEEDKKAKDEPTHQKRCQ